MVSDCSSKNLITKGLLLHPKQNTGGNQVWKSVAAVHGVCDHARLLCTQLAEERTDFLDMCLPGLCSANMLKNETVSVFLSINLHVN